MNSKYTKKILADALFDLLHTKPLNKIKVSEICKACGLSKDTFYYHFTDKYELSVYLYNQIISKTHDFLDKDHLSEMYNGSLLLCDLDVEKSPEVIVSQAEAFGPSHRSAAVNFLYCYELNAPFSKREEAAMEGRKAILRRV